VTQVQVTPGEGGHLVEGLIGINHRILDRFNLAAESLIPAPARASEEAVQDTPSQVDEGLATGVDGRAAEERRVLVGIDVLERHLGPNLRHRVGRDGIALDELRRVLGQLHHTAHHLGDVTARGRAQLAVARVVWDLAHDPLVVFERDARNCPALDRWEDVLPQDAQVRVSAALALHVIGVERRELTTNPLHGERLERLAFDDELGAVPRGRLLAFDDARDELPEFAHSIGIEFGGRRHRLLNPTGVAALAEPIDERLDFPRASLGLGERRARRHVHRLALLRREHDAREELPAALEGSSLSSARHGLRSPLRRSSLGTPPLASRQLGKGRALELGDDVRGEPFGDGLVQRRDDAGEVARVLAPRLLPKIAQTCVESIL
jgi:hypothetical protein